MSGESWRNLEHTNLAFRKQLTTSCGSLSVSVVGLVAGACCSDAPFFAGAIFPPPDSDDGDDCGRSSGDNGGGSGSEGNSEVRAMKVVMVVQLKL